MNRLFGEGIHLLLYPFLPFILFILVRGHNHPGGGFIAGVMAVIIFMLISLTKATFAGHGLKRVPNPGSLILPGLMLAVAAGFVGLLIEGDLYGSVYFGSIFKISLTSEFVFDLGIFLLVLGSVGRIFYLFLESDGR